MLVVIKPFLQYKKVVIPRQLKAYDGQCFNLVSFSSIILACSCIDSRGQDAIPSQVLSQQFAAVYTDVNWGKLNCLTFNSKLYSMRWSNHHNSIRGIYYSSAA